MRGSREGVGIELGTIWVPTPLAGIPRKHPGMFAVYA
jgi:hypothetical protein